MNEMNMKFELTKIQWIQSVLTSIVYKLLYARLSLIPNLCFDLLNVTLRLTMFHSNFFDTILFCSLLLIEFIYNVFIQRYIMILKQ